MTQRIECTVNGEARTIVSPPERPLLDVLREDLGLTGSKYGCGEGRCRSCTVLLDGRPVTSCNTEARKAEGAAVVTIEGLGSGGELHPIQQAFVDEGAMQCGFCVPGMIMTAEALLRTKPDPTVDEIDEWMNGNVCRCCGYPRIVAAIQRAAKALAGAAS